MQGDGLELPVIRIAFDAVDGWWIGGMGRKLPAGQRTSWFVGVAFRLSLG